VGEEKKTGSKTEGLDLLVYYGGMDIYINKEGEKI